MNVFMPVRSGNVSNFAMQISIFTIDDLIIRCYAYIKLIQQESFIWLKKPL